MILEIPVATFLVKKGVEKKNIILIISAINIVIYIVIINFLRKQFSLSGVIIGIIFLSIVFFLRIRFLKNYLGKI